MEGNNMLDSIIKSFDIWTDAQGIKSKGRVKSIDNISLGGIIRLRELILDLAVQGKLVTQDDSDEPATDLLQRISEEKERLIKAGELKKQKPLPKIKEEEMFFILPENWVWSRLGDLGIGSTGKTPKTTILEYFGGDIPFIGPGQIDKAGNISTPDKFLTEKGSEFSTILQRDHILMVCIGGSIGKSAIVKHKIAFNQQLNAIKPLYMDSVYLNLAMCSSVFQRLLLEKSTGSATPIINRAKWENLLVSVPPLEEQKRIVAKVDELMALSDKLEGEQTNNLKTHELLVKTLLGTLTQAKDANELQAAWERIEAHFDTLFCTEDSIEQLKQSILQLAVMGKLVKQDPNDEPASTLLAKIATEKAKLIKEKKIKKEKALPLIIKKEIPYELPEGWKWCRMQEVGLFERGKSKHRPRNDYRLFVEGKYPLVQTGDVSAAKKNGGKITTNKSFYNEFGLAQSQMWKKGTLCITIAANIAETGFLDFDSCFPDSVVGFTDLINTNSALPDYIEYFITVTKSDLEKYAPSTAQKNINLGILYELKFPLPPLAEQQAIVTKVNDLFSICDFLKGKIIKSQEIKNKLSKTIVEKSLK